MKISYRILFILLLSFHIQANSQIKDLTHDHVFPTGITLDFGTGHIAIQDDFFSKEVYSGPIPYIGLQWSRFRDKNGYQLYMNFRSSSDIKNNQISADIIQFSLGLNYLYSLKTFSLFSKSVYPFLGPNVDFNTYYNRQNFARGGIFFDFSLATMLTLGVYPAIIMPLNKKFQLESAMQLNVLSIVIRMPEVMDVDDGLAEEQPIQLLTPFSGLNFRFNFGIRYYIIKPLSIKLRYGFHANRITPWEYLNYASDNVIIGLSYRL